MTAVAAEIEAFWNKMGAKTMEPDQTQRNPPNDQ